MAAIQSRLPAGFRRNPAHRVVLPNRKAQRAVSVALPGLRNITMILTGVALVAIIYISGFSGMTAVSYQRARIMQQIGDLQLKTQLVQTKLTERTVKEEVAAWAEKDGMELA